MALPGVEALYRLMRAAIESRLRPGAHILIVGVGGGREVEALGASPAGYKLTGVDPSRDMLAQAEWFASQVGAAERTRLVQGTVDDLGPADAGFDAATSMLVMHFLPDTEDGKLAYLSAIRQRLRPGAPLVLADISFSSAADFASLKPVFLKHAELAGLDRTEMEKGAEGIASLPVVDPRRTAELLRSAGFAPPTQVFQTLWYRGWMSEAVGAVG